MVSLFQFSAYPPPLIFLPYSSFPSPLPSSSSLPHPASPLLLLLFFLPLPALLHVSWHRSQICGDSMSWQACFHHFTIANTLASDNISTYFRKKMRHFNSYRKCFSSDNCILFINEARLDNKELFENAPPYMIIGPYLQEGLYISSWQILKFIVKLTYIHVQLLTKPHEYYDKSVSYTFASRHKSI